MDYPLLHKETISHSHPTENFCQNAQQFSVGNLVIMLAIGIAVDEWFLFRRRLLVGKPESSFYETNF